MADGVTQLSVRLDCPARAAGGICMPPTPPLPQATPPTLATCHPSTPPTHPTPSPPNHRPLIIPQGPLVPEGPQEAAGRPHAVRPGGSRPPSFLRERDARGCAPRGTIHPGEGGRRGAWNMRGGRGSGRGARVCLQEQQQVVSALASDAVARPSCPTVDQGRSVRVHVHRQHPHPGHPPRHDMGMSGPQRHEHG